MLPKSEFEKNWKGDYPEESMSRNSILARMHEDHGRLVGRVICTDCNVSTCMYLTSNEEDTCCRCAETIVGNWCSQCQAQYPDTYNRLRQQSNE